jgi:hypothetical protein
MVLLSLQGLQPEHSLVLLEASLIVVQALEQAWHLVLLLVPGQALQGPGCS